MHIQVSKGCKICLKILTAYLLFPLWSCVDAYCDGNEEPSPNEYEDSFCEEVISNDTPALYNQDDYNILAALATSVLNKTYPTRVDSKISFAIYDEMPHPVPTGASSYFMVLFTVIFTWYFNKFIHWLFKDIAIIVDLFPITDHFPSVNLYMLQQSRRESVLNRDVRNTWAWLASYNLLQPADPLVNPDEIFRPGGWKDFQVAHDVWGTIKAVLRVNAFDQPESSDSDKDELQTVSESAIKTPTGGKADTNSIKRKSSAGDDGVKINPIAMLQITKQENSSSFSRGSTSSSSNSSENKNKSGMRLRVRPTKNTENFHTSAGNKD